jgi:hypothetical protein
MKKEEVQLPDSSSFPKPPAPPGTEAPGERGVLRFGLDCGSAGCNGYWLLSSTTGACAVLGTSKKA